MFRNAPIDAVLNEVLGERFGLSYSIDPSVTGSITLRLDGILTPDQAVAGMDAALRLQGFEIVESGGNFVIARVGQFQGSVSKPVFLQPNDVLPPGTSLAVLQIRYASVSEVTAIAKSMLAEDLIRYGDDARGFVVLSGDPEQVSAGVQLLKSLDVNWLSSVSTALIPVVNASPEEIASDLEPILSRLGGVSVVPLERLQTLMVISRQRESLDQAREWIARLDKGARPQLMRDVLVYEARYVNAEDLVALTEGGSASSSGFTTSAFNEPRKTSGRREVTDRPSETAALPGDTFSEPGTSLFESLSIRVDPGRNAVVARGASVELESLSELLSLLDKPKRQVLIEATIVEVSLTDGTSLGVQWDLVQDRLSATFTDTGSGDLTSLFPGVSVSYINTDIAAVINALAATSDVEIVSSPRMLVLNNETARLQVGDQVPIITQSAVSVSDPGAPVVNSTTYRDTGVILTVTPRIRAGGMVEVDISQEVSGVSETTTSSIDSPTISQRSIQSVLAVPDGSTAVLGGLMSSTRSYSRTGIPILKDTPVLGAAFRSTNQSERRTELIVLIEPTVVVSEEPSSDIPALLRAALVRARGAPAT
ncbi:secretin N-terminal domain-containing protein [Hyphomonas neptunium]|uniref:secretin N-terminal domain-containing protein n=1 Tax=Hyphomonas hirschiana TaxID=81030 RepID=UPI0018DEB2FD|nr:secretin N-terminal domain-containing protein [Hyphomonas hirschiana]